MVGCKEEWTVRWGRRGGIKEQEKRKNDYRNEWMTGWGGGGAVDRVRI